MRIAKSIYLINEEAARRRICSAYFCDSPATHYVFELWGKRWRSLSAYCKRDAEGWDTSDTIYVARLRGPLDRVAVPCDRVGRSLESMTASGKSASPEASP